MTSSNPTRPTGPTHPADQAVLRGTPFDSWRVPGLLLLTLVGIGFLGTAAVVHRGLPHARPLSIAAGGGLIAFEAAELGWLGFQPLELVFAVVGCVVVVLAVRSERSS